MTSPGIVRRAVPLDAVLAAIGAHLRAAGPGHSTEVLGADAELLMPMLGLATGGVPSPAVADGVVGPFPLFAGVLRVLSAWRSARRSCWCSTTCSWPVRCWREWLSSSDGAVSRWPSWSASALVVRRFRYWRAESSSSA